LTVSRVFISEFFFSSVDPGQLINGGGDIKDFKFPNSNFTALDLTSPVVGCSVEQLDTWAYVESPTTSQNAEIEKVPISLLETFRGN